MLIGMRESVLKLAPAKVNLVLAVGPADPRNHGMHPICSWMVSVSLYDELEVVRTAPDRLSLYAVQWHDDAVRKSDIDWPITKDLAVRAHRMLEASVGRSLPIRMKLTKRIPVGGGTRGWLERCSGDAARLQ
jgi:4-diphosphocytidyl-2C-methyl-D-erythritol kinase